MAFEYLPVMAQVGAPKPPRQLVTPAKTAWCELRKPLSQSKVALLTSAALRLEHQEPFIPREDLSYRRVPSDPAAGKVIIDHHSGIGRVPKQDPEIVFPRTALWNLARKSIIGAPAAFHISVMGGVRRQKEIQSELAPAIADELAEAGVDLTLLVPY